MEVNGNDDIKRPLLDSVVINVPGSDNKENKLRTIEFKIREIKCASCVVSIEAMLGELDGVESVVVSPLQGQAQIPDQEVAVCRFRLKGMMCTSCYESIERALSMVNGVTKAVVGLALEEEKIHYDPNITDIERLVEAIEDAGFGAELISSGNDLNKVHLKLEGFNTLDDVTFIQSLLESTEGVNHVELDFTEKKVTISYDPEFIGPRSLIQLIEEVCNVPNAYRASLYVPPKGKDTERQREIETYRDQFFLSCLFSVPIFMFSMVLPMLPPYGDWLEYTD